MYKLKCKECDKVYVEETGRKFEVSLREHTRGEGDRIINSLYTRYFMETGHKFINPLENIVIIKVENNLNEWKLYEELEILKEKNNSNILMNIKTEFSNEEIFYHIWQDL